VKMTRLLVMTAAWCVFWGLVAGVQAQPGGSSSQSPSSTAAPPPAAQAGKSQGDESNAKFDADAPENDDALHLTDEQKDKIKSIRKDAKQRVLDVQKDSTLSDEVKERKVRELRKQTRAQVWAVMTPDQQQQWANEQRARREARRAGSRPQE
jgi:Spy/CpxP family protein refolding chaperone